VNQQFFLCSLICWFLKILTLQELAKKSCWLSFQNTVPKKLAKFAHLQKQVTVSSISIDITKFLPIFEAISLEMAEYLMAFVGPAWDELPDDLVTEVRKFEIMFEENIFFASEKSHFKFKGREMKNHLKLTVKFEPISFSFPFQLICLVLGKSRCF
jgi:hypothetical protein